MTLIKVKQTFRGPLNAIFPNGEQWFFNPHIVTAKNGRQKRLSYLLAGKWMNGLRYYYDPEYRAFFRDNRTLPERIG